MEWVRGHLVEVKKRGSDNEYEWAFITGPPYELRSGRRMYPIWNTASAHYADDVGNIREFTGSDEDRNIYLNQWEQEDRRGYGRGGRRKKSRRYKRKNRKTEKTRRR